MALGDAFDLGDGGVGVVCVHGLTGTPFEMRYLGEQLAHAGFAVHGPLLPGHGTSVDELSRTHWHDWTECVERDVVAAAVIDHVRRHTSAPAGDIACAT